DPQQDEGEGRVDPVDHPGEVHPEEPGYEGEWQEDGRHHGEPVDGLVQAQVDQLCQAVAGRVDGVDQAIQLSADALEVLLAVRLEALDPANLLADPLEDSALGPEAASHAG